MAISKFIDVFRTWGGLLRQGVQEDFESSCFFGNTVKALGGEFPLHCYYREDLSSRYSNRGRYTIFRSIPIKEDLVTVYRKDLSTLSVNTSEVATDASFATDLFSPRAKQLKYLFPELPNYYITCGLISSSKYEDVLLFITYDIKGIDKKVITQKTFYEVMLMSPQNMHKVTIYVNSAMKYEAKYTLLYRKLERRILKVAMQLGCSIVYRNPEKMQDLIFNKRQDVLQDPPRSKREMVDLGNMLLENSIEDTSFYRSPLDRNLVLYFPIGNLSTSATIADEAFDAEYLLRMSRRQNPQIEEVVLENDSSEELLEDSSDSSEELLEDSSYSFEDIIPF